MKLVVFGANGRVGHLIVQEAVRRGHEVTAVIYTSEPYLFGDGVRTVQADVHNSEEVIHAVHGQGAVISALGSWGTPTQDIVSSGMMTIIPAMQQQGIRRIISLTGADARVKGDRPSFSARIMRLLLQLIGPKVLEDGERHIHLLAESDLDWTVVRSPRMKDGETRDYTLSHVSANAWDSVTRLTVVAAMLDQLDMSEYINHAPILHSR